MSILDINFFKKQSIVYFFASVFCMLFGLIYEIFSHNVYSNYMIFAFLIPLILGSGISLIIIKNNIRINRISMNLYNASVATFTIYSIFNGVLEIYGTTNNLINIYLYVGLLLIIFSFIINFSVEKEG